jgi:predicted phosphoribosyltransferase
MRTRFTNRAEAGRALAQAVRELELADPVVLAIPRGGVPVGHEVATALGAPLDVVIARKVGAPRQRELGVGAVAEGGIRVCAQDVMDAVGVTQEQFDKLAAAELREVDERCRRFRGGRPLGDLRGRDAVVVDDGLATGGTAEAALLAVAAGQPRRSVLAVPVCAADTACRLQRIADDVVCLIHTDHLGAVGAWYDDFSAVGDRTVDRLLHG